VVEVLREEGIDSVRYVLWDATGSSHRDYSPPSGETGPLKRQVEETVEMLSEGSEGFYKSYLD
jgi:hypothetical protein